MIETDFRYFTEAEVPLTMTLWDVLLWAAVRVLPKMSHTYYGIEYRRSFESIFDVNDNFGIDNGPDWLEVSHTDQLGIGKDPNYIEMYEHADSEIGIPRPEHCKMMLDLIAAESISFGDNRASAIAEYERLLPLAIEHDEYTKSWWADLDDALDLYRSQLLIELRNGNLSASGVQITDRTDDNGTWAFEDLVELERQAKDGDMGPYLQEIPTEWWISRRVDWKASMLRNQLNLYVAVQIPTADVMSVFPPIARTNMQIEDGGTFLFATREPGTVKNSVSRAGRPSKKWDAISVYVAEVIQRDGCLPRKQDALALEICTWYAQTFGETIGSSTVKAKLSGYYSNAKIQKSEK